MGVNESRALKNEILQALKDGRISLPPGETQSHVQSWTVHKCISVMAANNMVPSAFQLEGAPAFVRAEKAESSALAQEAAALQLARALTDIAELSRKLDATNQKIETLIHIVGRRP